MNPEKGKFIVFEGVGGSGKSTQVEFARRLLLDNGYRAVATREPGGVGPSETIRQLVFTLKDRKLIGAEGQMVLFFAARKFWVDQLVAPNLDRGVHVLGDRSYTSTGAYQGYAEGWNQNQILQIADAIMGDYKPDAILLLDISPETSVKRRVKDYGGDPFDREASAYLERLVAGYREMAGIGWGGLRWYMIDGEPLPEKVSESVAGVLEEIFRTKLQR